ncbi:hypothetical protein BKA82DRAFT_364109 [Pisolithus tinctorius]|uniref:Ubiquitin-like domain-containing protein n=1 Tax=Pisolithus tinctorius Marx 270 TaxID=870435 RepID=A0A0C3P5R7_PISTI|nr:hypothetical protein BKA82DRAFT_364109 [Pisolithus tinctorius]KIO08560.1 hypothetical protein M404DRAFT_364109 [Pisolithus tinctorius Marx 270]
MNGTTSSNIAQQPQAAARTPKLTPPPPAVSPPAPPNHTPSTNTNKSAVPSTTSVNGSHPNTQKPKKKSDAPLDPAVMYESLKNRIAALEEEEVLEEEEERGFAEEALKSVKGLGENAIHAKYIELFAELKRLERDHAREKQKLVKDKDAAKGQLTKANQTKAKMENLARELQKDNKRLREDSKRLAQCVEEAQEEILQMKNDMAKRMDRARMQDIKYREMPDIVVKVVCRYRAELFFKISRKTKFSRLFNAWTDRMAGTVGKKADGKLLAGPHGTFNGSAKNDAASTHTINSSSSTSMQFIFSHNGRTLYPDQTPEEQGVEDNDEILAVELMDLTEGPGLDEWDELAEPRRQTLKKNWTDDPAEARRSLEEIFDGVVRERLKEVLRQYELRERHFECVIRSKELEVLLSRARAAEQKQLADGERARTNKVDEENRRLRKELEEAQNGQEMLINKLISCCKEPSAERTQRLFSSLREELEKRTARGNETSVG